jgi:hypothetical protein
MASTEPVPTLSSAAQAVYAALQSGEAMFLDDLLARSRLLPSQLEDLPHGENHR